MSGAIKPRVIVLAIFATLVRSGYATCCAHHPIFKDGFHTRVSMIGTFYWSPPQSCGTVQKYEVLYTEAMCNTSNATVHFYLRHESSIILPPSEAYCIKVRAVINEKCYSRYSTCAQVTSFQSHYFNVTKYEDVCILVSVCWTQLQSKVILSSTQKHLTWRELAKRDNVNQTYNNTTKKMYICFHNVTDSFIFSEYCEVRRNPTYSSIDSNFCCNNWAEFVSRTCVNVDGGRDGGCLLPSVLPSTVSKVPESSTRGTTITSLYASGVMSSSTPSALNTPQVVMSSSTPSAPNTSPEDIPPGVIAGPVAGAVVVIIFIVLLAIVAVVCCRCHTKLEEN